VNIADHLWQSTAFAAVVGLLTLSLQSNRARVRHWLWFVASAKFLAPLSVLIGLGSWIEWRAEPVRSTVTVAVTQIVQPFTVLAVAIPAPVESSVPTVLFTLWIPGVVALSCLWLIRWRRIRRAVHRGREMPMNLPLRVVCSATMLEPGVFGIFRPVLLLPEGIFDRITPPQLESILAHELCHVRHRDNLLAAVHMLVETVFWFHPLVWWLGKRMVEERERACDEEVLIDLGDPQAYAEGILSVCKHYIESPLVCASGVTGADLRKRIEAIMKNRSTFRLNAIKKLILVASGIAAICVPLSVGILRAQGDGLLGDLGKYSFEVATIRPGKPDQGKLMGIGSSGRPGRWEGTGVTLQDLILAAYGGTGGGLTKERLVGGPKWMESNVWDVVGQASDDQAGSYALLGKRLQTLLHERFHLRMHTEQRQMPVFALTVSKPGKLTRSREDYCMAIEKGTLAADSHDVCGLGTAPGEPRKMIGGGVTMAQLAQRLGSFPSIGRVVVDRTGLEGLWDFTVTFMPAGPDGVESPIAPPIRIALQDQLGLKLEAARAPVEVLVVDQAEMPSEN
jgi:uncharacterized protein (TIGR03435 family)